MAHVMKHTRASCGHMFKHYERAKEHGEYIKFGNQDINQLYTSFNYNLAPKRDISQGNFVRQRCSEVRMQNRKDVNVMCSWVVTAPKDLPDNDLEKFFEVSYNFLLNRYGKDNVVSAYVHLDETTPHMHYAFVPVVQDKKRGGYKVSAKEVINRKDLQTFHSDFDLYMTKIFGRNIGVLNESTKNGNKSICELKKETAAELIDEAKKEQDKIYQDIKLAKADYHQLIDKKRKIQGDIKDLETEKKSLEHQTKFLDDQVKKANELNITEICNIQPKKALMGTIKDVSIEDIEDLKQTALMAVKAIINLENLSQNYKELHQKYLKLKKEVPSTEEKFEIYLEKSRLLEIEKAFNKLPEELKNELTQNFPSQNKRYER